MPVLRMIDRVEFFLAGNDKSSSIEKQFSPISYLSPYNTKPNRTATWICNRLPIRVGSLPAKSALTTASVKTSDSV